MNASETPTVAADPDLTGVVARYFHVLADPTRVRILELLIEGDRNVSELVADIGGGQSRVSNHLACLRWCGFVTSQRVGREVLYSVADPAVEDLFAMARHQVRSERASHLSACGTITPPRR
jgi:ArsR family transcriptional regulator, cadmium/lead-responsive transcriptional repressor